MLQTIGRSEPFDDQTRIDIQQEANAFLEIIAEVEIGRLILLTSDILEFEIQNILSEEKRANVKDYLGLSGKHIHSSEQLVNLGKRIQSNGHVRARDALHIASAILGRARYCLSCDKKVTEMKQARCYRRLANRTGPTIFQ